MKKMIFSLLAIAAMTSCTTTSEDEIDPNAPVEIKLGASILETIARSAGDNIPEAGFDFSLYAYTDTWGDASDGYSSISNIATKAATSGAITIGDGTTTYYYPANDTEVKFYGYAPRIENPTTENAKAPILTWTITGKEDITYATATGKRSIASTSVPNLNFKHLLTKLNFKVAKVNTGFPENITLTSIKISGAKTNATLDITTGTLTFKDTPTGDLSATITGTPTIADNTELGSIMLAPGSTSFSITVVTSSGTYENITISIDGAKTFDAGSQYDILLTFSSKQMSGTAEMTDWTSSADTGKGSVE